MLGFYACTACLVCSYIIQLGAASKGSSSDAAVAFTYPPAAVTVPVVAPSPVVDLVAFPGNTFVAFNWSNPSSSGGCPLVNFTVVTLGGPAVSEDVVIAAPLPAEYSAHVVALNNTVDYQV